MDKAKWIRLAVICDLIRRSDHGIGRTAVMKFLYLLKEVRGVPLGYRFTLYTYGPFDSSVLDDLGYAESLGAVKSTLIHYPGGYGYEFVTGPEVESVRARAEDFLVEYEDDIVWVVQAFGTRTAADLEMISTIVYVDRGARRRGRRITLDELCNKTVEVKPHLDPGVVRREAERLRAEGYLVATAD
jgi:uncharacterized protein